MPRDITSCSRSLQSAGIVFNGITIARQHPLAVFLLAHLPQLRLSDHVLTSAIPTGDEKECTENRWQCTGDQANDESATSEDDSPGCCDHQPSSESIPPWKRGIVPPPFVKGNREVVEYVLALAAGSMIPTRIVVSQAVAIPIYGVVCDAQLKTECDQAAACSATYERCVQSGCCYSHNHYVPSPAGGPSILLGMAFTRS